MRGRSAILRDETKHPSRSAECTRCRSHSLFAGATQIGYRQLPKTFDFFRCLRIVSTRPAQSQPGDLNDATNRACVNATCHPKAFMLATGTIPVRIAAPLHQGAFG
jgi:hypothetical protein